MSASLRKLCQTATLPGGRSETRARHPISPVTLARMKDSSTSSSFFSRIESSVRTSIKISQLKSKIRTLAT